MTLQFRINVLCFRKFVLKIIFKKKDAESKILLANYRMFDKNKDRSNLSTYYLNKGKVMELLIIIKMYFLK